MTRLALVNAIYFKGSWKSRFIVENTKEMLFKVNQVKIKLKEKSSAKCNVLSHSDFFCWFKNETKPVQMMYQMHKLPYNYIPDHGLQILELPYVDEELSMFILLPVESQDGSDPLLKVRRCNGDR